MNHLEERLQCTSEELRIYLILLAFGSSSKNELSTWTTIPEEDLIQKLHNLEEKGYISKFGGIVEKWTPYFPLGNFINQLTSFQTDIANSVQEVLDTLHREQEILNTKDQEFFESIGTISSSQSDLIVEYDTRNRELVDKTSSDLTQSIKERYMEIQEEIRKNLEEKLSLILNNLRETTEDIKTKIDTSLGKNTENLSITKESIDSVIIEYQTSAISTLDSFKNSLNGLIDSFEQTTSTIGEVFITTGLTSLENVKETTQKSTDLLTANTTKSTEISASNILSFHEKLELTVKRLKEHLSNLTLELIEKLMESFSVQVHGFQNTIQDITSVSVNKTSEFFKDGKIIITETGDKVSENLINLINDLQTGANKTVSSGKSSFQSTFEQISSQTDEVFNNSLESLTLSETELKTDLDNKFQEYADIAKGRIAEAFLTTSETVSENLATIKNGIAENIGNSSQNIEFEIHHAKDNLIQDIQDWQDSIATKKTSLEENLNIFRSDLKSKFDQEFTNGKDQVTNKITDIIGITGIKVEESSGSLETESRVKSSREIEKIQQWMNYFSETISNITISIEDKFNQAEESLELKYRGFQESLKQEKAAIIKKIQEEQEILSGIINDLQGQIKESWENYTQTAIQVLDENNVTITENLNMANNELNSFITSLHDSSKESLDKAVSSNLDILKDLQEETRRISEEGIANLTTTAENQSFSVRQAINQQIQSILEIITTQNDSLNESLSIASDNTIISSNDLIENTKELLKQSFDEQISTIKSKAQKLIESSKMSINETNTGINASFTDLQEQLNSILQTSEIKANEIVIQLNELNGKLYGIDQSILATQNEYLEKVSTSLSNFRNSTQELINRINTQNLTKLENFQNDSIELIHNSIEQIKKHNTGLQASINNYLQGLKLGFNFRLNEVETALNRKKESFNHSLKTAVKESKQSLNELIRPSNIYIESVSDETKIAVEEYLNSTKEETINLLNDLNSNTTDILENIKVKVEENYQTLKSDSKSLTDEIGKTATSGINTIRNQSEEAMNQITTTTQETILNMKNKTEDGIKQVFNDLINVISDQVPAILKTGSFDRVVKESEDLSQLFTDLLEQVKEHQRPNELTQFIHTKKAIINHVNDWLRTAKAGVNIIVPSYVDLDMDVLKEIPMRRRVTIYTNVGNKAWMKPFIDKSNIRFFHLETGEGTQLPPVYAVDRESEEILFAPASEMKAPMAILSSEEPYINAIANNLMSQYMAMARKVDPRNP